MRPTCINRLVTRSCRAIFSSLPPSGPSVLLTPRVQATRYFTDTVPRGNASDEKIPPWVQWFNDRISVNPSVSIPVFLVVRNASWYALAFVYTTLFSIGPEFGIAYLAVRLTGNITKHISILNIVYSY